ncbi:hypothetical protein MJ561_25200 [Klebsiella pneumoniae]|nr:hypothetical protein MJ561_25200 [Klebsiella pneumoniae]
MREKLPMVDDLRRQNRTTKTRPIWWVSYAFNRWIWNWVMNTCSPSSMEGCHGLILIQRRPSA